MTGIQIPVSLNELLGRPVDSLIQRRLCFSDFASQSAAIFLYEACLTPELSRPRKYCIKLSSCRMKDTLFAVGLNELLGCALNVTIQRALRVFPALLHSTRLFLDGEAPNAGIEPTAEALYQALKSRG